MMRCRKEMEEKSKLLAPLTSYPDGLPIYFLTGQKYLYQTLFCIKSLVSCSKEKFSFVLVDDGSFNKDLIIRIKHQLPGSTIIDQVNIQKNLNEKLPINQYPHLHRKRIIYPHIKKITDIHTISSDPNKLILDSDMLFWEEPKAIINWLKSPTDILHMVDCVQSYGYTDQLMEKLANDKIKPLINVGVIGISSEAVNWDNLEYWIKKLESTEGTSYYLEQALTAMIIGSNNSLALDAKEYVVNPLKTTKGILHHYVDLSKKQYYENAWRQFLK